MLLGQEGQPLPADKVFDAPSVDPLLQGQGFLLFLDAPAHVLRPGTAVTAYLRLATDGRAGVLIPRSAVVWAAGEAGAYAQVSDEGFIRRPLRLDVPTANGWFTAESFAAGDRIVIVGAQALLSEEQKAQIQLGLD